MSTGTSTGTGLRIGPVGLRVRRRAAAATAAVLAAVVAVVVTALLIAVLALAPERELAALAGEGSRIEALVVDRRLTRALAAVLVGAALGCSGALSQTITRNPIASPDVLGVTAGASAAAVLVTVTPLGAGAAAGVGGSALLGVAALAGGVAATALVLVLSWRGGFDGYRLVLVGIGVNALALAAVAWLLTRAELEDAAVATRWMTGSLDGVRAAALVPLAVVAVPAALLCAVLADRLGALRLGREVALSLGTRPARTELQALVLTVALASVATAVAGPVGFVAFVAPQAAMRLFRTAGPPPLAGAALGALLVLVADTVAQWLPAALPVGIITSVIGAPYLLSLMIRSLGRTRA
ncbi:iron ABC transporter permease [Kineococcus glutinatus]|uniref:Iron complex transport system permease protein n=1 Tax=Kineococcus glutinatus TaxID=1070872 RepID=A0ABP9HP21_9ACTN